MTGHQGHVISLSILQTRNAAITARPNLETWYMEMTNTKWLIWTIKVTLCTMQETQRMCRGWNRSCTQTPPRRLSRWLAACPDIWRGKPPGRQTCEPGPRNSRQTPSPAISGCPPQSDPQYQLDSQHEINTTTTIQTDTCGRHWLDVLPPVLQGLVPLHRPYLACPRPAETQPSPRPAHCLAQLRKKFEKQKYSEQGGSFFKWIPNLKIYFQPDCEWCFTPDGTELGFCISSTMIWTAILLIYPGPISWPIWKVHKSS